MSCTEEVNNLEVKIRIKTSLRTSILFERKGEGVFNKGTNINIFNIGGYKMNDDELSLIIKPSSISIKEGETIDFEIQSLELSKHNTLVFHLTDAKKNDYDACLSMFMPIPKNQDVMTIKCPNIAGFKESIYRVASIYFQDVTEPINEVDMKPPKTTLVDFNSCLFEVNNDDVRHTEKELKEIYDKMTEDRVKDFLSGFGEVCRKDDSDVNEYVGMVFIKDCLVTRRMILGQYQIIPFDGLECNDELKLIQRFMNEAGSKPITSTEQTLEMAKNGQPTAVVHFPNVFATSVNDAGNIMEREVKILCDLLSIYRSSYASIFGVVICDKATGDISFKIITPLYSGNLIGGAIAGEQPLEIRDKMENVKKSQRLQFYLTLYNDALRERVMDIAYFRFWNLLETIARSKGYIGQTMYDWQSNAMINKHNKIRKIQDDAVQQVTELIRRIFKNNASTMYACGVEKGHLKDQINVWYRHRNCMVHAGGCFAENSTHCIRDNSKYIECKEAYDEMVRKCITQNLPSYDDQYLRNLQEVVHCVLINEINGRKY